MTLFFRLTIVLSLPFKKDHRALPDDWWCDVLGFVPAGSVSSSSTLQIFRDVRNSWWLLCRPVCLLGYYLWLLYIKGSICTGDLEGGCRTLCQPILPARWICVEDDIIYVVGLSLPEAMFDYFYCQAGGWDRIGFIVFHGWWSQLAWQWNPTLTGLCWLSYQCTLWDPVVTVFLNEKLDLWFWVRFACWPLSAVPSQVFWQDRVPNSGA